MERIIAALPVSRGQGEWRRKLARAERPPFGDQKSCEEFGARGEGDAGQRGSEGQRGRRARRAKYVRRFKRDRGTLPARIQRTSTSVAGRKRGRGMAGPGTRIKIAAPFPRTTLLPAAPFIALCFQREEVEAGRTRECAGEKAGKSARRG